MKQTNKNKQTNETKQIEQRHHKEPNKQVHEIQIFCTEPRTKTAG